MAHRLEPVGAGDRDHRSAEEARETLRDMCRTLTGLLRETQQPARRVAMAVGAVSIEVEWSASASGPAVALASTVPMNGGLASVPTVNGTDPRLAPGDPALAIRSPLVGTFYRAPEPGAPPFVGIGDIVEPGQQIGIVEAMKLMNPVEADRRGRVTQIVVGDAEPVEYDQLLVVLAAADDEG